MITGLFFLLKLFGVSSSVSWWWIIVAILYDIFRDMVRTRGKVLDGVLKDLKERGAKK